MGARKAIVIGAGFSGLASAAVMAQKGYHVTLLEKNSAPGGRARSFTKDGFKFDMGPSWYWMPEIMEQFFNRFSRTTADLFELRRLDPSYQVIFDKENTAIIPADYNDLKAFFESREAGSADKLDQFLAEAQQKYETGMGKFVNKPCLSIMEFVTLEVMKSAFKLDLLSSFSKHVRKYFKSEELLQLLEFPILFLGALPKDIPALYSMMNYADMKLGTWYPMGGFGKLVDAMVTIAQDTGVTIELNTNVETFEIDKGKIRAVHTSRGTFEADVVISSADYHFTEQKLLERKDRTYSPKYWEKRTMAPSCLIYYLGVNKKISRLQHHNLFFEENFAAHARAIYTKPDWPTKPLYYVCCPSKTDPSVAPEGMENLFILIPVAPGLQDTTEIRQRYFKEIMQRLEEYCGENIEQHVISYTDYAASNFIADYNAFKGNAYGLANTWSQTAVLKPSIKSSKVKNLYYTGQLTVPGPGVPPAIISGQLVADCIIKKQKKVV